MEFFFADPNVERVPPTKTRFLDLRAEPDPDGRRIRVALELTPFEKRPNIELSLTDMDGTEISSASIIEPVGWKLELTLHIRKVSGAIPASSSEGKIDPAAPGPRPCTLHASLYYPDLGEVDRRQITISCGSSS